LQARFLCLLLSRRALKDSRRAPRRLRAALLITIAPRAKRFAPRAAPLARRFAYYYRAAR
jgi:hypothetical protein